MGIHGHNDASLQGPSKHCKYDGGGKGQRGEEKVSGVMLELTGGLSPDGMTC